MTSQQKDIDLTSQHKDLTRRHKDLTSQNNSLTSDGRNMPPYTANCSDLISSPISTYFKIISLIWRQPVSMLTTHLKPTTIL